MVPFLFVGSSITSAVTWIAGTLVAGAVTYDMAKRRTDTNTQTQSKTQSKTAECDPNQGNDCDNGKHSGRMQAQEDKETYVSAVVAGSVWTDWSRPPTLDECTQFANNCRNALNGLSGPERGRKFQEGADVAHANLVKWMRKNTPAGIPVLKISFYFDGDSGAPNKILSNKIGKASKRMDLDILKGEALKG